MSLGIDAAIAAETRLSSVDGEKGELIIRGHYLDHIAGVLDYEEVITELFQDLLGNNLDPEIIRQQLSAARHEIYEHFKHTDDQIKSLPVVDALRALLAKLEDANDLPTAIRLVAAPAVFTALLIRARQGKSSIPPLTDASHAQDILHMAGLDASEQHAQALDTYLVTIIDHGLNASTFTSRVVASTHAGLTSSAVAALSALKGPLHGGAPGPVLDMLDAIGSAANARSWLEQTVRNGDRLMGFGHRIYKVRDPRADALKRAIDGLKDSSAIDSDRLNLAINVERTALEVLKEFKPQKPLHTNVEFYTALLLDSLGFSREDFTCIFAIGRIGGWLAHAREQYLYGRLIRPQSTYTGPKPN
ncbi:citrate synthase/methylcitrate synthase [Ectopseudomonas mendocina]|uniref:Citrate synthase n=1 Tax=Ectopseudomonas mendocina TaxID=300 RepID=A0ABZ2RL05_ECTME